MRVLGIDPGRHGAVAVVDRYGIDRYATLPWNGEGRLWADALEAWIGEWTCGQTVAYIERQWARPTDGKKQAFALGCTYGSLLAVLDIATQTPVQIVEPKVWQAELLAEGAGDTKARALDAATRLWKGERFRATTRARTPHDGIVDACLIAYYGLRCEMGGQP